MIKESYTYKNIDKTLNDLKKIQPPKKELSFLESAQLNDMLSTNYPRPYIAPKNKLNTDKKLTKRFLTDVCSELVAKTKKFFGSLAKKAKL